MPVNTAKPVSDAPRHPRAEPTPELLALTPELLLLGFVFNTFPDSAPDFTFEWSFGGETSMLIIEHHRLIDDANPWRVVEMGFTRSDGDKMRNWYESADEVLTHVRKWLGKLEDYERAQRK